MSPSISVSLPKEHYFKVMQFQERQDCTVSAAAAALIKMGFAWEQQEEDRNQEDINKKAKAALKATIQEESKKSKGKGKT